MKLITNAKNSKIIFESKMEGKLDKKLLEINEKVSFQEKILLKFEGLEKNFLATE